MKFGMTVQTWGSLPSHILYKKNRYAKGVYPLWANLYQKLQISAILGVVSPHFKSDNGEIWPECTDLGYPALNCVKVARGICPLGKFIPNIRNFRDF